MIGFLDFGFIFWSRFWVFYFLVARIPVLANVAMSPTFFFSKIMKKHEKTRKNTKKGGPEKRSFFDPFVPGAIFGVFREKWPPNSPPSGTFSIFFVRPRSCFYTVPVLVVGGVQSGGNFFCSFLKTFFRVCTFVFAILGVDIIPGGVKNPVFRVSALRNRETKLSWNDLSNETRRVVHSGIYGLRGWSKPNLYRSCHYLWPIDWSATHERHSVDNRLDPVYLFFC